MAAAGSILHLLCGKIAAGKSTLAARLAAAPSTIVVSEDAWLSQLYPGEQNTLEDYLRNAARLRAAIGPHLVALLQAGLSLVLDFPANTPAARAWLRGIADAAGVPHQLHYLQLDDASCLARLERRNAAGEHPFVVDAATFALFTSHFVAPAAEEGLTVVLHSPD